MTTEHLPPVVAFNTPFVMLQPAVPGDTSEYVTAPVPEPPENDKVIPVPAVPEVGEPKVPRAATALAKVSVTVADAAL